MGETEIDHRSVIIRSVNRNPAVPQIKFILEDPEGVVVEELKGGVANFTFRVQSADLTKSAIFKYGLTYFRKNPTQSAPLERRLIEYEMLKRMHGLKPGSCPEPYFVDMEENLIAMEDMSHMKVLSQLTIRHETDEPAMRDLAEQLSSLHWTTQKKNMTEEAWNELYRIINVPSIRNTVMDFYFVMSVDENDGSVELLEDMKTAFDEFKADPKLVEKFIELRKKVDEETCLIHTDCHHNNLFVHNGKSVMFDLEMACLSVPEINVATVFTFYILFLHMMSASEKKEQTRTTFSSATKEFLTRYLEVYQDTQDEEARRKFLSLTAEFLAAACYRLVVFRGITGFIPGTTAQRAALFRHLMGILGRAESITTVDSFLEAFFSDPTS